MCGFPGGSVVQNPFLLMQETQVQSLVGEDPTYGGETKPMRHSQPLSLRASPEASTSEAHTPYSSCSTAREATATRSPHAARKRGPSPTARGKPPHRNEDLLQPKYINR